MEFKHILFVAFGGALGSILRYLFSFFLSSKFVIAYFPVGTFIVNVIGCFLMGILFGFTRGSDSDFLRLFLMTGFCGGFTTFSAFALENVQLFQSQHYFTLVVYILLSILLGSLFFILGTRMA